MPNVMHGLIETIKLAIIDKCLRLYVDLIFEVSLMIFGVSGIDYEWFKSTDS